MAPAVVVRDLFLRALGAIALIAFGSLQGQARLLFGSDGLAPACAATARSTAAWWQEPSLFAWQCSDRWLELGALAGMLASVLLIFHVLPRLCLLAIWLLYLSFVTVGSPFLDFQWDNLLLETCFFSWWIAPWRGGSAVPPSAPALFLMRWLLFRLHFESGIAKLASGDPTWRDLTAMVSYYETAPLPTWIGWYAHQMPEWLHRLSSAATFAVELLVPFLFWGPFALRRAAFVLAIGFHLFVLLTANYTIFNYLSIALCLFLLAPIWPERGNHSGGRSALARWAGRAGAVILIGLSTLPFLGMLGQAPRLALPLMQQLAPLRTFNAYHLFASMT
ncbi:MAG TPA: lipase maturation factor family protein, partial [Terriglobales bacterium]|nr:lipase maturation factor family protein [Terriglobales bacterium]